MTKNGKNQVTRVPTGKNTGWRSDGELVPQAKDRGAGSVLRGQPDILELIGQ
jgi:hypothetical protein